MLIALKKNDGSVSIMKVIKDGVDIDEEVKKVPGLSDKVESWNEIDESSVPKDRYFRNAWTHDLSIDMDKAKSIHMDVIREKRDEKLKELDIETLKGNDVQEEKQALRDLPQTFDLSKADTPEKLKKLWPKELI